MKIKQTYCIVIFFFFEFIEKIKINNLCTLIINGNDNKYTLPFIIFTFELDLKNYNFIICYDFTFYYSFYVNTIFFF